MGKIIKKVRISNSGAVSFWLCDCCTPPVVVARDGDLTDSEQPYDLGLRGWRVLDEGAAACGTTLAEIRRELEG